MKKKKENKDKLTDECDWCGKITEVENYAKDKRYSYCKECIKEIEECD
jgi:hypothetical protein